MTKNTERLPIVRLMVAAIPPSCVRISIILKYSYFIYVSENLKNSWTLFVWAFDLSRFSTGILLAFLFSSYESILIIYCSWSMKVITRPKMDLSGFLPMYSFLTGVAYKLMTGIYSSKRVCLVVSKILTVMPSDRKLLNSSWSMILGASRSSSSYYSRTYIFFFYISRNSRSGS